MAARARIPTHNEGISKRWLKLCVLPAGLASDGEKQLAGRSKIQVTVKGRTDLTVRTRRHYFDFKTLQSMKSDKAAPSSAEDELKLALGSFIPSRCADFGGGNG